jgi:iron complex transport system substrate-binding protein
VDAEVISLDPRTIGEIEASVRLLADRLDSCRAGSCERGVEVVSAMRRTIVAAMDAVAGKTERRVFVAEWLDPPFASGHWVPEMVELAGGRDVLGRAGQPSYPTTWDEVAAARPELIVAAPCGFDRIRAEADASRMDLPAPHVAVDANAFFSRPSPRIAEGVAQLAQIMHGVPAPA